MITTILQRIFGDEEVVMEHPMEDGTMVLDVWVPSVGLAVEFQGDQHYQWHFKYGTPYLQQKRDEAKKKWCEEKGIKLVHVPYWWAGDEGAVETTIRQAISSLLLGVTGEAKTVVRIL